MVMMKKGIMGFSCLGFRSAVLCIHISIAVGWVLHLTSSDGSDDINVSYRSREFPRLASSAAYDHCD